MNFHYLKGLHLEDHILLQMILPNALHVLKHDLYQTWRIPAVHFQMFLRLCPSQLVQLQERQDTKVKYL